jgi:ribose 5-phosphate isomerase B
MRKSISIACDHAGYLLKEFLKKALAEMAVNVEDFGAFSEESVDYPDFAKPVCLRIVDNSADCGILICGTGNGMAMSANKFTGIRAALCWDPEIAVMARKHNNANILVLPARFMSFETALDCLNAFLNTEFEGGRHIARIEKMMNITED